MGRSQLTLIGVTGKMYTGNGSIAGILLTRRHEIILQPDGDFSVRTASWLLEIAYPCSCLLVEVPPPGKLPHV